MICHSLLQGTTFFQKSLPWPVCLRSPYKAWLILIELAKAVVHVIRLVSFLWLWLSFCMSSGGEEQEAYGSFLMGETDWGGKLAHVLIGGTMLSKSLVQWLGFSSVHYSSVAQWCWLFATLWIIALQASLSITNSWNLLKLMFNESVMPGSHLILCRPLLLLTPIPPSIRVFSNESTLHMMWPKFWIFSFRISPSNEHPGLISFRVDWLDLLAVQGTLKTLLQHHRSKASILWCSAVFTAQLSHPYMTTAKNIVLTGWNFDGKVMFLLFNVLSRLVISFLPWSKQLLFHGCNHHLQWFWSPVK